MKKSLFPQEFINSSIEHYTFKLRKRSISIYTVLVLAILVGIAALPFVTINVTTSVAGFIGTKENRYDLNTSAGSFILKNELEEGKRVTAGDTLLMLDNAVKQKELSQVNSRLRELNQFLADLQKLISHGKNHPPLQFLVHVFRLPTQNTAQS